MRPAVFVLSCCLVATCAQSAAAQGGRFRGRPEEITNRVGAFFVEATAPAAEDGKPVDLARCDLVQAASGAGQPSVLYLFDGGDDEDVRQQFERAVLGNDEIGIMLRCFHCGSIDLQKAEALQRQFAKQAPLFVTFDPNGKVAETASMPGYKAAAKALEGALQKAAHGAVKPSLAAFAKEYGNLVRDLEQLLSKQKALKERQAKAGADRAKKAELDKDMAALEKEQQKLLDKEKGLVEKAKPVERPANARRLGAPNFGGGRGGRNGGGGGENGGGGAGGGGRNNGG